MKRRLFNAIAVLSAVLCVATLALWVRSRYCADAVEWIHHGETVLEAGSELGRVRIAVGSEYPEVKSIDRWYHLVGERATLFDNSVGFRHAVFNSNFGGSDKFIVVAPI